MVSFFILGLRSGFLTKEHPKKLLIRARQSGRWMYYSLNLPQFVAIEQYLADLRRNATMNPASGCE